MKISEFYPALTEATKKLGIEWYVSEGGQLRGDTPLPQDYYHYCPITLVCHAAGRYHEPCEFGKAAKELGLAPQAAMHIALAADARVPTRRRKKLEQAMGLTA